MPVNKKKRGRPNGSGKQLTSETIIENAKALMKEEGKIPSIRKLAASLNVDAMAIYYYFENKNKLLESVTVSLVEEIYQPQNSSDWQAELNKLSTSYLTLLSNYPGLLETLLKMTTYGPAEVFIERFETIIQPLDLGREATKNALDLLADYLHGYALALNCRDEKSELNIDTLKGPLDLYCLALDKA